MRLQLNDDLAGRSPPSRSSLTFSDWDKSAAMAMCMEDSGLLSAMASSWVDDWPRLRAGVLSWLSNEDFDNLRFFAHSAKGGSMPFCVPAVSDAFLLLERMARERNGEGLPELISAAVCNGDLFSARLQSFISSGV